MTRPSHPPWFDYLLLLLLLLLLLFLFRSARNIGLRQRLAIRGSCFSFLDPLDIW
jgi:hypothetical protein